MSFWDRYHFIPRECVSRRSDPRNSTRSKPDITPLDILLEFGDKLLHGVSPWFSVVDFDPSNNVHHRRNANTVCGFPLCGAGCQPADRLLVGLFTFQTRRPERPPQAGGLPHNHGPKALRAASWVLRTSSSVCAAETN